MIVDPFELRARPSLIPELRAEPGKYVERRYAPLKGIETRDADDGSGSYKFGGLAAVYDEWSVNLGGFREKIARGAFRKVLATDPDVRALFNHDANYVLARTAAGTLRLKEVGKGLQYEGDAADTTYARDLRALFSRGDVDQSSFAFRLAPGGDEWDEDPETGGLLRTIHEFSALYDVSPVTDPAYPQTTAGLRGRDGTDLQLPPWGERAAAEEQGDRSDARSAESLQGGQADYLVAARQRQLRRTAICIGRTP